MKKTKIIFWIVTGLFSAFMLFSSIPDILMVPEAKAFMNNLGYPDYIIPFLGVMKLLGIIAILIPGFPRMKEWAYAGLFFDLLGAIYSGIAKGGFDPRMLVMILPIGFLFISYNLFHKLINTKKKKRWNRFLPDTYSIDRRSNLKAEDISSAFTYF